MDQLTHCVIGHDADGIGEGWLCERIIVTNPQSGEHWLFACNKYVFLGGLFITTYYGLRSIVTFIVDV